MYSKQQCSLLDLGECELVQIGFQRYKFAQNDCLSLLKTAIIFPNA